MSDTKQLDEDGFATAGDSGEYWNEDHVLIGKYVSYEDNVGANKSMQYSILEDGKDKPTKVWGSTVLDSRFEEEINVGMIVKITFLGKVDSKNGRGQYKTYEVKYKEDEGTVLSGDEAKEAEAAIDSAKEGTALPDPEKI